MDDGPYQIHEFLFVPHYYFTTVGAMLPNSLQTICDIPPGVFQQYFEDTDAEIRSQSLFQWELGDSSPGPLGSRLPELQVVPRWRSANRRCSRVAIRLASFHVQQSADFLAHVYERIADESVFSIVKTMRNCDPWKEPLPNEIVRSWVITGSICLSVIECIAGEGYNTLQHATRLHSRLPKTLQLLTDHVDKLVYRGMSCADVAILLALIHWASRPPSVKEESVPAEHNQRSLFESEAIIGCRKRACAVLPNLLFSLEFEPSASMLSFRCIDSFVGNNPVQKDGFIRSIFTVD